MRPLLFLLLLTSGVRLTAQDVNNLALYLPFDNAVGDASGNDHYVAMQDITFDQDRNGKPASAARFDGRFNRLHLNDDGIIQENDLTISGWFNFSGTLPSQQTGQLITKYRWDLGQRNFRAALEDGLLKVAVWYGSELSDHVEAAVPVARDVWNHFAFSISADNVLKLYLNGCLICSKPLPGPMQLSDQPIRIGNTEYYGTSLPGDNHHFNGLLDELRVYTTEQSAQLIEEQAEQQPDRELPEAELLLSFNGSLADSSSSGYLLTGADGFFTAGQRDTTGRGALAFDGYATEYVLEKPGPIKKNDLTVAGWFNSSGVREGQQYGMLLSKYTWEDGERSFTLAGTDTTLTLEVWFGLTLGERISITAPLSLEKWHSFAFSIAPDNLVSFYLDDCLVGVEQMPAPMRTGTQPLRFGNARLLGKSLPGDNHHFFGKLDEVQLYHKALTPCQLPALQPTPYQPSTADPATDTTTAVINLAETGVAIYPNPTERYLSIQSDRSNYRAALYTLSGKRIEAPYSEHRLDLGALPRGTYILRLQFPERVVAVRIIRQ